MEPGPVVQIDGVLLASVHSGLTDEVVAGLRKHLLEHAAVGTTTGVIIDVSAAPIIDSHLTRTLIEITQALRLLAAPTVVAGISPAVAITMVEMGLSLPGLATARSVGHALLILSARESAREPTPPMERRDRVLSAGQGVQ